MTLPFSIANTERQTVLAELAGLPPKPPRSKLEPHRELIRELRRKGRTYREVAHLFHDRLGLHVALSTLHSFVKVRAKHRKRTQFELPPVGLACGRLAGARTRCCSQGKARSAGSEARPLRFP